MLAASCGRCAPISSEPETTSAAACARGAAVAGASAPLSGNDKGLVQEPQAAVRPQPFAPGGEGAPPADHPREALVVGLRHRDGGVPGSKQGRGTDAVGGLCL